MLVVMQPSAQPVRVQMLGPTPFWWEGAVRALEAPAGPPWASGLWPSLLQALPREGQ